MTSSEKGDQRYFGMKAHIGVDARSGLVHTAGVTTGKVRDAKVMANLIREDDTDVYGDKCYASDANKCAAEDAGVLWAVKERAKPGSRSHTGPARSQSPLREDEGEGRARVPRAQMPARPSQSPLWRLAKNGAQVSTLFALANLYLVRGRLESA